MMDSLWHRAFSFPEAFVFELMIAPALAALVTPEFTKVATGRVLDVGAGGGSVAALLAQQRELDVVALDPSRSQRRRALRRAAKEPRLTVCNGRADALPFADNSFDTVVSSCAWKHWPDPSEGIAECLRVLRPGGTLTVIEIDGTATRDDFWQFARTTRFPVGMKRAYWRFSMHTVVRVAPNPAQLAQSFGDVPVKVSRIDSSPFLIASSDKSENK
jgi:ubiquinone/menaquinone biosynthesis C-methylase UbiE